MNSIIHLVARPLLRLNICPKWLDDLDYNLWRLESCSPRVRARAQSIALARALKGGK